MQVAVLLNMPYLTYYVLPRPYAEMVTKQDIDKINSGLVCFAIIRAVKKCGPNRIHFHQQNYTWDLELRRV